MKILITTSSFGKYDRIPLDKLRSAGLEIIMNPFGHTLSKEEALELYTPDIEGVIAGVENITEEMILRAKNLKVISRCGIGLDNIDAKAAKLRNIRVLNTPEPVIDAVAELTLCFILCCLRNVPAADNNMHRSVWDKPTGLLLKGKILGIVGLGNIGKRVVELTGAFKPQFLAYDKKKDTAFAKKYNVIFKNLETLLSESDIVSLHLPLTEETKRLLNAGNLSLMKLSAFLINTSRAQIIDENALIGALTRKQIAGAALDVFEKEPYAGPLTGLSNVILTPHIGSYTKEARSEMELQAVDNLIKALLGYGR
ncbi:MAG: phosphoglycerate dehydrogenase [Candidatus Omnitrophota bacterium]